MDATGGEWAQQARAALRPPGTDQLVANEGKGVTPARSAAAERMARMRARKAAAANIAPLMYERADWRLFVAPESLPQRAGAE